MKTTLVTFALILAGSSALQAQTEKGRWMIGTSFGSFSYQDNNTAKSFSGNLTPSVGYFVVNNLLIGTGLPLSLTTSKPGTSNPYLQKTVSTGIGLSPFVRYYFGKSALKPYIGMAYSHTFTNLTITPLFGEDLSSRGYSDFITPGIGLAYFVNRTIALNAGLNYTSTKTKQSYYTLTIPDPQFTTIESDAKILSLSLGIQIFVGK